jgi:hypothetical protein
MMMNIQKSSPPPPTWKGNRFKYVLASLNRVYRICSCSPITFLISFKCWWFRRLRAMPWRLKMTEVRYWNFERHYLKFWRWLKFVTGILSAIPWSSEDDWSSLLEFWAPFLEVLKMTEVRYWNFERHSLKFWRWLKFGTGILSAIP